MKSLLPLTAAAFAACTAHAQINPLPPPSIFDGIFLQGPGYNAGPGHWNNPASLGAYHQSAVTPFDLPPNHGTDNRLGLSWSNLPSANLTAQLQTLDQHGGTLRTLFLGHASPWLIDLGYCADGVPDGGRSFTVIECLPACAPHDGPSFGNFVDYNFSIPDSVASFDLWFNFCSNTTATPPHSAEATLTLFNPGAGSPTPTGSVMWASSPLMVSTWLPALNGGLGGYEQVATYLVGLNGGLLNPLAPVSEQNDFVFAFQFHASDGMPFADPLTPIPEPSTYGLLGSLILLAGVIFRSKRSPSTAP